MKTRKVFQSIVIFCLILTLLLPSAKALAEGNPSIQASTFYNYVRTQGWPEGTELNLTISGIGGYYTTSALSEPISTSFDLQGRNVLPGDIITVTGGTTAKELQVSSMTVTGVDPDADTVWGTAEPGTQVNVWVCDVSQNCANRYPIANESGNWIANFSITEPDGNGTYDLVPGTSGGVNQFDTDGDWTEADWRVRLPPYIQACPFGDWVRVYDWYPIGVLLTLTINDGSPFTTNAGVDPWDNSQTRTYFDLYGFDLEAGDNIKVTDGNPLHDLSYTPTNLQMTSFDLAANTISGIGTPGELGEVYLNTPNNSITIPFTPDWNGNWTVSFNGDGDEDLVAGSNGGIFQPNQPMNHTFINWQIPSIEANPDRDMVQVYNWPVVGTLLTLTINEVSTFTAIAEQDPWDSSGTRTSFNLNGFDLKAGDDLEVTDVSTPSTVIAYTVGNIAMTGFDLDADTISGIGTPDEDVQVCFNMTNYCIWNSVTPAFDGTWTASFSGIGDLDTKSGGWLVQPNQRGNHTSVGWQIPQIEAYPTREWVRVLNWPVELDLTVTINGTYTFTNMWPGSDYPTDIYFMELGGYDLKAGDLIKVTDNATPPNEITFTVGNLALTGFDLAANTISGIGAPGIKVSICGLSQDNCTFGEVTTASDGSWTYTFSGVGDQDLSNGGGGWLGQETPGGGTASDWGIPGIVANLTGNWVQVLGWPVGRSLTLTINNVSTFYATVVPALYDNVRTTFDLGGFDLKAYDNLKVTDNANPPNELTTTTANLTLTGFDLTADTISGIGTPGVDVGVCLGDPNSCWWSFVTPASDGTWIASFNGIGDEDLVIGSFGELSQTTQNGLTLFDWEISYTVINQPPQITNISLPIIPIPLGQSINATAAFLDPDLNDTHTATWDWGDGQSSPGIVDESNQTVSGSHTYASAGVYTITLTLTDAAGETASAISEYVVIYDRSAGFVTGGGWINSPAGAYTADPSLTGKATFGFISKYQKGANVPTGNTEFQFKVGNLNFSSTAYDWLVIAGAKAQYKGVGTINGIGSYRFMLTAIDGQILGGGGVDKFRIKIWDLASEHVVYDNQLGAGDSAIPTTAIQGGSIVIHK
jgi:hypothetical protein